jgi:T5orf172 domain-containing protein
MVAYVYLLEEIPYSPGESGPWTKIGCSRNPPEWRLGANLKRGNPRDLLLAAVYEFETEEAAYEGEARAHTQFQQFAHQKEWFKVSWAQVADWAETSVGWRRRSN